jgi:hypothetical protein
MTDPKGMRRQVRNSAYGYGRLHVVNRTHLHWEQVASRSVLGAALRLRL